MQTRINSDFAAHARAVANSEGLSLSSFVRLAIADSQAAVYVIDARDTPAQQAKYIQLHKASMKPTLDKNHSIFFIHSPVSALKHKR